MPITKQEVYRDFWTESAGKKSRGPSQTWRQNRQNGDEVRSARKNSHTQTLLVAPSS